MTDGDRAGERPAGDGRPTQPLPTVVEVPPASGPPRRRRRGRIAIVVTAVVLALLVVGFVVGDHYARAYATNYVREKVATAVGLKTTRDVHVDLGSGSIILQALEGHLHDANVSVDPLTIDGATGSASVSATSIPLDSSKPVGTMRVLVDVPSGTIQSQLTKAVPELKTLGAKITVAGGHVLVTAKVSVLGFFTVPLSASVTPGVSNGGPTFALDTLTVSGKKTSAATLDHFVPGLLASLKSGKSICIANLLPREFTLTGVRVRGSSLVYTFSGDGAKLDDAALNRKGSCPAA